MKDSVWVNLMIGIWLIVAAFLLAPVSAARAWNDIIFGLVLIGSSWWILAAFRPAGAVWLEFVVGLWLIASPFALSYVTAAGRWNDIICGVVAVAISLIALQEVNRPTRIA
jgi:hypothetical protein